MKLILTKILLALILLALWFVICIKTSWPVQAQELDQTSNDWTVTQVIEEGATVSTLLIDWHQTREISSYPGFYERNPILGKYPEQLRINRYFGSVILGQFFIGDSLPGKWRDGFLGSITLLELDVIGKNKKIGLSWSFK